VRQLLWARVRLWFRLCAGCTRRQLDFSEGQMHCVESQKMRSTSDVPYSFQSIWYPRRCGRWTTSTNFPTANALQGFHRRDFGHMDMEVTSRAVITICFLSMNLVNSINATAIAKDALALGQRAYLSVGSVERIPLGSRFTSPTLGCSSEHPLWWPCV